ncbi:MAG TPA: PEP/pyruvate-binding domain-containing protein [Thermoleophilia bacterium]|nr:PEP/pyruvate-binding domain-containing protein [Thermoleophilia bacterium]
MPSVHELLAGLSNRSRFQDFEVLMSSRVENIILVSSLYDKFILQEDGQLSEVILGEFLDLHLHHTTGLTHVSSGAEAIELACSNPTFNLIITAINVGDMNAVELANRAREAGLIIPVIVLAYDGGELSDFVVRHDVTALDRLFLWQGDVRILLAIIKYIEDKLNAEHDTQVAGVQVILVVEDSIRSYSSFLPMIFTELIRHSQRLIPGGMNIAHKILRMRARPKILLCTTYEEAWENFTRYQQDVLGIISDIEFPRDGELDPEAGVEFATHVRELWPDVPVVLQSGRPENEALARRIGASFLLKGSATLLHDLRRVMIEEFSFGDFVFRLPDGSEIDRAGDLRTLAAKLHTIPIESMSYHAERNDFSRWLKARTEFALAHRLRPRKIGQFDSAEAMKADLIEAVEEYRREQGRTIIADFDHRSFDTTSSFSRIGGGSLGGKARALAFVRHLLGAFDMFARFPGVQIAVPPSVVLGTDVFDQFLDRNDLRDLAIHSDDDDEIERRFQAAALPHEVTRDLASFLELIRYPLAVRSSSLLEDSQYQPLAGVYETFMLPNNHPDAGVRLRQLEATIKRVYASTFSSHAKSYLEATLYRLEEEKMAVIIQKVVGATHEERFYPDISGVARSYNFYPTSPMTGEDGVAIVALGLGRTVVKGERAHSFCPKYPRHQLMAGSLEDTLRNSQREFWAVELGPFANDPDAGEPAPDLWEKKYPLEVAEEDGTLAQLGSTYSPENDALYDGVSRPGVRVVNFAPLLKFDLFPLADIVDLLLEIGAQGMGTPVEIEFAANLTANEGAPKEFAFLQVRPMGFSREMEDLTLEESGSERVLCHSTSILGNGRLNGIKDVVVVDISRFDRSRSLEVAREVARLNARLTREGARYILIGVGRWGSADPWLGIPVNWDEIAGARVIVESELKDIPVTPSQGSHFFQNLTSFRVGYFTVNPEAGAGRVDWEWLAAQPAASEGEFVRHLRFDHPLVVSMNGTTREGIILKPKE